MRACADFFGADAFLVISGDALTDIDLTAFAARHREAGGVATLAVKQVPDTREYGVVLHDAAGRVTGFQEKPEPEEALSNLGNCGIYIFDPAIFDYFPERPFADWAQDVFPALLERDVPFHIHEVHDYWNDVGSLAELRQGTFDALRGELRLGLEGREVAPGVVCAQEAGSGLPEDLEAEGPVWIGRDVRLGAGVRLKGPVVLGDGGACRRRRAAAREHRLPRHRDRRGRDPDRRDRRALGNPAEHAPPPRLRSATGPQTAARMAPPAWARGKTGKPGGVDPRKADGQPPPTGVAS